MHGPVEQLLQQAFELFQAGAFPQAEGVYHKILDRDPNNHEAIHMTAVIAHSTGQTQRAASLFARSIELAPNVGHYHQNAGKFFAEYDQHEAALPYLRRAAELAPTIPNIHANLANSLRFAGKLDEAETAARDALAIDPNHSGALAQLGNVLREMGRVVEASDALYRSVQIRQVSSVHENLIFVLYNHPDLPPADLFNHHLEYSRLYTDPLLDRAFRHDDVDRSPDRKLRIGYVSADFRQHPVTAFMDAALRSHDTSQFDVTCYSVNLRDDHVTRHIKTYPLTFTVARFDKLEPMAERIRKDRIDILVDLAGHTGQNRLVVFALQPAPVQISYLGDPGSTGMRQINYRITDAIVDPPGRTETFYTETLLRLPGGFSCYTPDPRNHPDVSPLPALDNGYFTFGSLHALAKINEQVIDLWARVLHAVPNSRLLMLRNTLAGSTLKRYTDAFTSRGIDPSRLDLRHQYLGPSHLHAYRHIDLALDAFPFSGHTTSCEALFNGVPTLTLNSTTPPAADNPPARLVSSVLTMAGLTDFIATTPDDLVSRAVKITSDLPKLAALRARLRQQMLSSPLCDATTFTRELESAYRTAWRKFCATPRTT